jgi:cardiolipin synthase
LRCAPRHLLVDDAIAVAGSANLDMRSLYLNYELALSCYDANTIAAAGQWMGHGRATRGGPGWRRSPAGR